MKPRVGSESINVYREQISGQNKMAGYHVGGRGAYERSGNDDLASILVLVAMATCFSG